MDRWRARYLSWSRVSDFFLQPWNVYTGYAFLIASPVMGKELPHVVAVRFGDSGKGYVDGLAARYGLSQAEVVRAMVYETQQNDRALCSRLYRMQKEKAAR